MELQPEYTGLQPGYTGFAAWSTWGCSEVAASNTWGLQCEEGDLRGRVEQRVGVLGQKAQVELAHGREVDGQRWLSVSSERAASEAAQACRLAHTKCSLGLSMR